MFELRLEFIGMELPDEFEFIIGVGDLMGEYVGVAADEPF